MILQVSENIDTGLNFLHFHVPSIALYSRKIRSISNKPFD